MSVADVASGLAGGDRRSFGFVAGRLGPRKLRGVVAIVAGVSLALTVVALAGADVYSSTVSSDGPLAYWRLGETSGTTAVDASGNGHNGTYSGSYSLHASPLVGSDNGSSAGLVRADGGAVRASLPATVRTAPFTVEAWVKPDETTHNLQIFGTRWYDSTAPLTGQAGGFDLSLAGTSTGTKRIHTDIGTATSWINTAADASFAYSAGQTLHVVEVVTTSRYQIYVNGTQLVDSALGGSGTPVLWDGTRPSNEVRKFNIGHGGDVGSDYFSGQIDEVSIYGTALSAARVQAHYQAGERSAAEYGDAVRSDAPLAFWRLDEISGTTAADSSGNGHSGTYSSTSTGGYQLGQQPLIGTGSDPSVMFNRAGQGVMRAPLPATVGSVRSTV